MKKSQISPAKPKACLGQANLKRHLSLVTGHMFPEKGFSLIEVLITLAVISIGVASTSALMVSNIKNLQNSKNQIIASMLAQEGIELVRNVKDNGKLKGTVYRDMVEDDCYLEGNGDKQVCPGLRLDFTDNEFNDTKSSASDKRLYFREDKRIYVHDLNGKSTKFFRKMDLEITGAISSDPNVLSSRQITVTSTVTWNDKGFVGDLTNLANCNVANKCISIVSVMPDTK